MRYSRYRRRPLKPGDQRETWADLGLVLLILILAALSF